MKIIYALARKFAIVVLLLLITACGVSTQAPLSTASPAPASVPSEVIESTPTEDTPSKNPPVDLFPFPTSDSTIPTPSAVLLDVTYCTMDSVPLKMDLYFPPQGDKPSPVLMYVHGGGWSSGDRKEIRGMRDLPMFTDAGYVVIAIDYRLAPEYHFPAMIQDVKCAVRYLRAHAEEYNLDPDRFAAWGLSAGGHLVSLLGLADESAGWDVGEYLDQSSRVQAVISMFGLVDLTVLDPESELMQMLFGVSHVDSADLARASAATYISPDDPPFMIVHGNRDWVVPQAQSVNFDARLDAAGVPSQLLLVKNAGHGFIPMGKPLEPSVQEVLQLMLAFLNQRLNFTQ